MREQFGDLFSFPADWVCIPTNGQISQVTGRAVMGKGVAIQAQRRYPEIDSVLGLRLQTQGNHVHLLGSWGKKLVFSFPTKEDWRKGSPLDLLIQSCSELHEIFMISLSTPRIVLLPQIGCGVGGLLWEDVRGVIQEKDLLPESNFVFLQYSPTLEHC